MADPERNCARSSSDHDRLACRVRATYQENFMPTLQENWNRLVNIALKTADVRYDGKLASGHDTYRLPEAEACITLPGYAGLHNARCVIYGVLGSQTCTSDIYALRALIDKRDSAYGVVPPSREVFCQALGDSTLALCMDLYPHCPPNPALSAIHCEVYRPSMPAKAEVGRLIAEHGTQDTDLIYAARVVSSLRTMGFMGGIIRDATYSPVD